MKKLSGIRLINWHAFVDELIEVNESFILSGENGAGKSTIFDAIQFILTCSKNNFNKAANENSKRTLSGYVRHKTGKEGNEFERDGDITSHVALEFYDEGKKQNFIIGAVIDSTSETSEKIIWYRIEKTKLIDINFMDGDNIPLDISRFRTYGRSKGMQSFTTMQDGKKDFLNRLGRLNEKFLSIMPKALAFKPITNVKDFVNSYILEEKEISIEDLRVNIKTYKEWQGLIEEVREKIDRLNNIKNKYIEYERIENTVELHKYIVEKVEAEILAEEIKELTRRISLFELNKKSRENDKISIKDQKEKKEQYKNDLSIQRDSNDEYRLFTKLEEDIKTRTNELNKLALREKEFNNKLEFELTRANKLYKLSLQKDKMSRFVSLSKNLNIDNVEEFKEFTLDIEEDLNKLQGDYRKSYFKLDLEINEISLKIKELDNIIAELEKRNLQYPKHVIELKNSIKSNLNKIGINETPKIICELLEVTDLKWKNAVEAYLNTQRFYLLIDEKYFDRALETYERVTQSKKIHSVGLINSLGLEKYDSCNANSLAHVVVSKNQNAKRYINMILGGVIRCEKVNELKKHNTSITNNCMLYKNNVARSLDPKLYEKPFIGEEAFKIQLEVAKRDKEEAIEVKKNRNEEKRYLKEVLDILESTKYDRLREECEIIKEIEECRKILANLKIDKDSLEKNNNFLALTMKINEVEEQIKLINNKYEGIVREIGQLEEKIHVNKELISVKEVQYQNKCLELEEISILKAGIVNEGNIKFKKEKENKSLETIKINYTSTRNNYKTRSENISRDLCEIQREYNRIYEFGAEVGVKGISIFIEELDKLVRSTIIEYEEEINKAKRNAEEQFKDHFISKIQENIINAKREFNELNKALKGVVFGEDEYEFKMEKNKDSKINQYYNMIMDDENIGEGFTLFSDSYQNKYKDLLDELFVKLTIDDESSDQELQKFTDYRTYMSYDIKIKHKNGNHSLFSKVCREKSGGETQTPYYVAMAASFVQLYASSINTDSIGLILFDEAFDKMDEGRITAMMEFFKKLPLQLGIAVPPQKIDTIVPHVNTTLLAIKGDGCSIVEGYSYEKL